MFFIMGISQGSKRFDFVQSILCKRCGQYGRYEAFMTYTVLSLFFIPVLKWSRHYYVKASCCDTVYEISSEIGKRIAKGEQLELTEDDLGMAHGQPGYRRCPECSFLTMEDYEYCPKCGEKLI